MKSIPSKQDVLDWAEINTVLLDMDGTLLDRHFDDYFWQHFVPHTYAEQNDMAFSTAKAELLAKFKGKEGTLDWTDLDYWSQELSLDIPAMKNEIDHLIQIHPYVIEFLEFCRRNGQEIYLITNAHPKTLAIKMEKTALHGHFDQIICSQDIGLAKEMPEFWQRLEAKIPYDKGKTLLADDTEAVLDSAAEFGINKLVYVARPSSSAPIIASNKYRSITYFKELMD